MRARALRRRAIPAALAIGMCAAALGGCHRGGAAPAPTPESPEAPEGAVNVGYGTRERAGIAGSVGSLDSTAIAGQRVTHVEELLLGRVPGVEVTRTSSGVRVRVRGATSFHGTSEPLFVVDGMPLRQGTPNPLQGLNPADIARIDVLKDAAASIYGSQGANGVILVTTKRPR